MPNVFQIGTDNVVWVGEQAVDILGSAFGFDLGTVLLSPTNTIEDPDTITLSSISTWVDDHIVVDLPFDEPQGARYWFVRDAQGVVSLDGLLVEIQVGLVGAALRWTIRDSGTVEIRHALAGSKRRYEFDFSQVAEIAAGQRIIGTPLVVVDDVEGIELGPTVLNTERTIVQLPLLPAVSERMYVTTCEVTTDTGAVLIGQGQLRVV